MLELLGLVTPLRQIVAGFVIAIALGSIAGLTLVVHDHRILAARDAVWEKRLADATAKAMKERDAEQAKRDAAAATERAIAATQAMADASHIGTLESMLTARASDPIAFPREIARELRR